MLAGAYLAGALVAGVAVLAAGLAACFLCFFTFVVEVELLGVEVEGAGVWAITVPTIRERPIKAGVKSFIAIFLSSFVFWKVHSRLPL
jgi:hypothetical protein